MPGNHGNKKPPWQRAYPVVKSLPPCKVCGVDGAGFHYGVNSCEACKAFFYRSLSRKEVYTCTCSDQTSDEGKEKKKATYPCAKCRYEKCLSIGMSLKACKTGRYSKTKRKSDQLEVLKLVQQGKLPADRLKPRPVSKKIVARDNSSGSSCNKHTITHPVSSRMGEAKKMKMTTSSTTISKKSLNESNTTTTIRENLNINSNVSGNSGQRAATTLSQEVMTATRTSMTSSNNMAVSAGGSTSSGRNDLSCLIKREQTENETRGSIAGSNSNYEDVQDFNFPESPLSECGGKPVFFSEQLQEIDTFDDPKIDAHMPPLLRISDVYNGPPLIPTSPPGRLEAKKAPLGSPRRQRKRSRVDSGDDQKYLEGISKEEREEFRFLVSSHRKYVSQTDYNDCPEEYLQEKLDDCIRLCQLRHNPCQEDILDSNDSMDGTRPCYETPTQKAVKHMGEREKEIKELTSFFKNLPEFKQLSLPTQVNLLKESFQGLSSISGCRTFHAQSTFIVQGDFTLCPHETAELGLGGRSHGQALYQMAEKINSLRLTYDMKVLLKMAIVFNPEDENQTVEKLNRKYTEFLVKLYERSRRPQSDEASRQQMEDLIAALRGADSFMQDTMEDLQIKSLQSTRHRSVSSAILSGASKA